MHHVILARRLLLFNNFFLYFLINFIFVKVPFTRVNLIIVMIIEGIMILRENMLIFMFSPFLMPLLFIVIFPVFFSFLIYLY